MKRILIAITTLILIYIAFIGYYQSNLMINIISDNKFDREIMIKVNSEIIHEGVVKKSKGSFSQDVTPFGFLFFPRMIEIEIMTENCRIEKESYFVFIPQTVEVFIGDNCKVEFDKSFGRVGYF